MGWRGAIRSYGAAVRRAERAAARRRREDEKLQKAYDKWQVLENAKAEVKEYEETIESLIRIHCEASGQLDWAKLAVQPEPRKPVLESTLELEAQTRLDLYQPSFFARLLKLEDNQRKKLNTKLEDAKAADLVRLQIDTDKYNKDFLEWKDDVAFVRRILSGDTTAYAEAILELKPFEDIGGFAEQVIVTFPTPQIAHASLAVHSQDVIPSTMKSLLQSGKLSEKPLPKAKFFEIYQDYVCSSVLRVAREMFALLPLERITIDAIDDLLNPATGNLESQIILEVEIPRESLATMNMTAVDPSECLRFFNHRMEFNKTSGFKPVRKNAS